MSIEIHTSVKKKSFRYIIKIEKLCSEYISKPDLICQILSNLTVTKETWLFLSEYPF